MVNKDLRCESFDPSKIVDIIIYRYVTHILSIFFLKKEEIEMDKSKVLRVSVCRYSV